MRWRKLSPRIQNAHNLVRLGFMERSWDWCWGRGSVTPSIKHLATQPSWVSESQGTVMRLHLKSQGGRYLQNSTWGWPLAFTCSCTCDDKDWPLPLLPWRDRDSTFTPNQDQARSQLRWEGEEGDFVTGRKLIQSHRSEKQHSELPKPSHGAQRASLASASVFTEGDFGLLVLCKRLLNSRSSQCLFRELLDLSRSHKITQTLGA